MNELGEGGSNTRRGVAVLTLGLAAVVLTGCGSHAGGTEALADEVVSVHDEFASIVEKSAHSETSVLDDRLFTALGRDYRQLGPESSMVAVPRGLLSSTIDGREGRVIMVLSTTEHSEHGLTYEQSNAFTCLELTGTFDEDTNVERRNVDCSTRVLEAYLGSNHYSIEQLNYG